MAETALSSTLIKLPVPELKVGMFVAQLEDSGKLKVAAAGLIKSEEAIQKLKKSGIEYVWIDPSRAQTKEENETPAEQKEVKAGNRDLRQQKAKKLLGEAKNLIRKVLSEVFDGKEVDAEPFGELADKMIESVMQDSDALKCVSALRNKDAYLLEHSVNVSFLLVTFGRYLNLDKEMLRHLSIGGILHDVGKTRVDNDILNKPGKLTPEEFEEMKMHQVHAITLLDGLTGLSQISKDVSFMHHEKLDGKGYPRGLKGDEIPLHGRMSCICDIYDALTANRCYKEAMSPAEACKILLKLTPFHLDQKLVYQFIRCIGVYPVGSLVELSDGRLGIVWDLEGRDALHPVVKCFYSLKHKKFVDVKYVDVGRTELNINRGVSPCTLEIDPTPFY
ncbi:HD-GYP domain-containing protein [Shewanella corallii]|uniref:HD-GYP domain-containing protein n=1 Tax=Shewanella corallii TaxID=560080 RepID=A0ABT0N9G5_9GAMM|nr:HD-GYP domain-containing protein [Shewanella corallii]MCL2915118.1 HD-GYP domain-containing protein [Shewanella corallii]